MKNLPWISLLIIVLCACGQDSRRERPLSVSTPAETNLSGPVMKEKPVDAPTSEPNPWRTVTDWNSLDGNSFTAYIPGRHAAFAWRARAVNSVGRIRIIAQFDVNKEQVIVDRETSSQTAGDVAYLIGNKHYRFIVESADPYSIRVCSLENGADYVPCANVAPTIQREQVDSARRTIEASKTPAYDQQFVEPLPAKRGTGATCSRCGARLTSWNSSRPICPSCGGRTAGPQGSLGGPTVGR